ncbi:MAG: hypothetical protein ACRCXX_07795 [Cetobacterium sp.]|uniref:hypothetical protein n=1 Tax=Cetobacterium sp. TaxID=2071632 RepID=UPI003F33DE5A
MREKIKTLFEGEFAQGYIEYIANQATVFKLTEDGNLTEEVKIVSAFTKSLLVGVASVLGTMKSIERPLFGLLLRDDDLQPLVQFSVRYRQAVTDEDNGSFSIGMQFRPNAEDIIDNRLEFTDPLVINKISNTLMDRDKIEFYPQYITRLTEFLFKYIEQYLMDKYEQDADKDYEIELPGYIIIALTYSELSEKTLINFIPYEEMKRLIKSDTMLEIAKA